ncbi:MAG TPA: hypothetical protein VNV85_14850 [Puia sp.]|jgi:hypothetical protein|nr:hypothetical protein [Puia sp.]
MRYASLTALIVLSCICLHSYANDSTSILNRITNFPNKLFGKINNKAAELSQRLDKQTEKYLNKLSRQEAKLKKKLSKFDSAGSKNLFPNNYEQQYALWLHKLKNDTSANLKRASGEYYPYVDSLQTSLSFLKQNPQLLDASKVVPGEIQGSLNQLQILQAKMQDADLIKQYIQQRKEQLKLYLSHYTQVPPGIISSYNDYNKQMFYYTQQVKEYKDMLNDPGKMTNTALALLNRVPAFTHFFQRNSMLASLFNLPGNSAVPGPAQKGQGLASRDEVIASFQNQLGKGGPNLKSVIQKNVQSAQGSLSQLTDKLSSFGSSSGANVDMPDFKPNSQKTKSFFKRLIYGTDLQTVHSSYFFPATSDIGLSLGYKLDDNNMIGIGASYKMGWGKDINHISISNQGASLRSYADVRIKKSFFASGGFEFNYQQPFDPADLPRLKSWQQSGLLGVSKIISLKTKVFKSTKLQILWDFLSYEQIPKAQPFKVRVGYSF